MHAPDDSSTERQRLQRLEVMQNPRFGSPGRPVPSERQTTSYPPKRGGPNDLQRRVVSLQVADGFGGALRTPKPASGGQRVRSNPPPLPQGPGGALAKTRTYYHDVRSDDHAPSSLSVAFHDMSAATITGRRDGLPRSL